MADLLDQMAAQLVDVLALLDEGDAVSAKNIIKRTVRNLGTVMTQVEKVKASSPEAQRLLKNI